MGYLSDRHRRHNHEHGSSSGRYDRHHSRHTRSRSPYGRPRRERYHEREHRDSNRYREEEKSEWLEEPDFRLSGLLYAQPSDPAGSLVSASASRLKYKEPTNARVPHVNTWRLYMFPKTEKSKSQLEMKELKNQSAFLLGRNEDIVDIVLSSASCSKQHAVIQFLQKDGDVNPYVIDLNSTNSTLLNNFKLEPQKYHQLKHKDLLNFGDLKIDFVVINSSD